MKRLLWVLLFMLTASTLWAYRTLPGDHAKCYRDGVLVYEGKGMVWPVDDKRCNVLTSTGGYKCTSCVAYFEKGKKSR